MEPENEINFRVSGKSSHFHTYWVLWLLLEQSRDHVGQDGLHLLLEIRVDRKDPLLRLNHLYLLRLLTNAVAAIKMMAMI